MLRAGTVLRHDTAALDMPLLFFLCSSPPLRHGFSFSPSLPLPLSLDPPHFPSSTPPSPQSSKEERVGEDTLALLGNLDDREDDDDMNDDSDGSDGSGDDDDWEDVDMAAAGAQAGDQSGADTGPVLYVEGVAVPAAKITDDHVVRCQPASSNIRPPSNAVSR